MASWTEYAAPAWLRIWPAQLRGVLPVPLSSSSVGGPLGDHVWKTDAPVTTSLSARQETLHRFHEGLNSLNIERLPEAWPFFQNILARTDSTLELDELPEFVEWEADQKSGGLNLLFTFREPLTRDTRARIAASSGMVDRFPVSLSDGTSMTEIRLPFEKLGNSSSGEWIVQENRALLFKERSAFIGTTSSSMTETESPKACGTHVLAGFNQLTLDQLASVFGQPSTFPLQELWWAEKNGNIIACW